MAGQKKAAARGLAKVGGREGRHWHSETQIGEGYKNMALP